MKHYIIPFFILSLSATDALAQAVAPPDNKPETNLPNPPVVTTYPGLTDYGAVSKRNFVRVYAPQQPFANEADVSLSNLITVYACPVSTGYFDGLGRPLQEVTLGGSGTLNRDLVQTHVYDNMGREATGYAPYSIASGTGVGKFKTNPLAELGTLYQTEYPYDQPYSVTQFENSPLSRPTKIMPPGSSWVGSSRGAQFSYLANTANDKVIYWRTGMLPTNLPTGNTLYAAGEVYLYKTVDEDGKISVEIKNKQGQVICRRTAAIANPSAVYQPSEWLETYFVYDIMGRLRHVLSPEAIRQSIQPNATCIVTTAIDENLCFKYWYDKYGRIIEKRIPGKAVEYFVYDKRGNVVFSQDGNLRNQSPSKWQMTGYDALSRPLFSGIYSSSSTAGPLQDEMNNNNSAGSYPTGSPFRYLKDFGQNTPEGISITGAELTGKSYYDHYDYPGTTLAGAQFNNNYNSQLTGVPGFAPLPVPVAVPHGMATGGARRVQNPDGSWGAWLPGANFYDEKGRVIQVQATNINNGQDIITNQYNFGGSVASVVEHYHNPQAITTEHQNIQIVKKFDHFHQGQKLRSLHEKINGSLFMKIKEEQYDNFGRLKGRVRADLNDQYSYNIRGWLTGINADYVDNGTYNNFGPFFGEKLSYDRGFKSRLYNGNAAGMQWRGATGSPKQFYGYSYDALDRLTHAEYAKWEPPAAGQPASWTKAVTDYGVSGIAYDANGNLRDMLQRGPTFTGSSMVPGDMDKMHYDYYPSSNQLKAVTETSTATPTALTPDFRDNGANGVTDYSYDANGNLTTDKNKAINQAIIYSTANKPLKIIVDGKGTIEYTYDAAGNLLRKKMIPVSGTAETQDFIGSAVFKENKLKYVLHEEGRSRPIDATNDFTFDYFAKDHLQNVRAVISTQSLGVITPVDPINPPTNLPRNVLLYRTTMEVASANTEGLMFEKLDEVREDKPLSTDPGDLKAAMLDGSDPNRRVGTSIMLRVMPGDKFSIAAMSYFEKNLEIEPGLNGDQIAGALFTALSGGTVAGQTPVSELPENMQILESTINTGGFASAVQDLQDQTANGQAPASHLNFIVTDKNMRVIKSKSGALIATGEDEWVPVTYNNGGDNLIEITEPGYITIFTSNRSLRPVYWDQISIVKYEGSVLEEDHYYPFGLTLAQNAINPGVKNDYKYNSIELNKNFGLEMYEAFFRGLDPQTGRWWQVDPEAEKLFALSPYNSMGNNPVGNADPMGDYFALTIGDVEYRLKKESNGNWAFYNGSSRYEGDDAFANKLTGYLNKISKTNDEKVKSRFNEIATDNKFRLDFEQGPQSKVGNITRDDNGKATAVTIIWNPNGEFLGHSNIALPAETQLVHEVLGHGWVHMKGFASSDLDPNWNPIQMLTDMRAQRWEDITHSNLIGLDYTERDATSIENRYRDAHRIPRRNYYTGQGYTPDTHKEIKIRTNPSNPADTNRSGQWFRYPAGVNIFLKGRNSYE